MTSEGIAEAAVEKKQSPGNYNSSVSLAALSDTKSDIPSCPKTHVWPRNKNRSPHRCILL